MFFLVSVVKQAGSSLTWLQNPKTTWARGYIFFFMLSSTKHKLSTAYRQMNKLLALNLSDVVFIMLINVKMPTFVGILTFMSRINFVLC